MTRFREMSLVQVMKLAVFVLAIDLAVTLIIRVTVGNDGLRHGVEIANVVVLAIALVPGGIYLWRRTLSSGEASRPGAFSTNLGAPLAVAIAAAAVWWITLGTSGAKPLVAAIAAFCIYQAIASYLRNRKARRA